MIKLNSNEKKLKIFLKKENFFNYKFYKKWGRNCLKKVKSVKIELKKIRSVKILIEYGAAAKANTFLNFSKIKLNFIIDNSKLKQNKFCPGSKTTIKSASYLKSFKKIYTLFP